MITLDSQNIIQFQPQNFSPHPSRYRQQIKLEKVGHNITPIGKILGSNPSSLMDILHAITFLQQIIYSFCTLYRKFCLHHINFYFSGPLLLNSRWTQVATCTAFCGAVHNLYVHVAATVITPNLVYKHHYILC